MIICSSGRPPRRGFLPEIVGGTDNGDRDNRQSGLLGEVSDARFGKLHARCVRPLPLRGDEQRVSGERRGQNLVEKGTVVFPAMDRDAAPQARQDILPGPAPDIHRSHHFQLFRPEYADKRGFEQRDVVDGDNVRLAAWDVLFTDDPDRRQDMKNQPQYQADERAGQPPLSTRQGDTPLAA